MTLTLVDRPVEDVSAGQLQCLRSVIATRASETAPFSLRCGLAIPNTYAIELYIEPHPLLTTSHTDVAAAYREAFPGSEPEPRHKPFRGYTAIAYCVAECDHTTLASALLRTPGPLAGYLGPASSRVEHVLLPATDPWAPDGRMWDHETAQRIPLEGAAR